ncbi:MAG: hypothetical protein CMH83_10550 [Nocardioides sp.]|nr:hypothetical protein [Nocardioides sp.]
MKAARRVGLEVLGWGLLLVGIAALVLPGPGLILTFAGLAVLSQQYEWAEKRLDPIKYRALKGAAESVETPVRIGVSLLGVAWLVACGVVWIVSPPAPDWWGLPDSWWLFGGVGTGVTLLVSAVIAAGLLVWSYQRYHGRPEEVDALREEIDRADARFKDLVD